MASNSADSCLVMKHSFALVRNLFIWIFLIEESDYVWCANVKDNALLIKNIRDNTEHSLTYHNFGIAARVGLFFYLFSRIHFSFDDRLNIV
jgi:hypothetical protein